jgi:hypothetical protein
VALMLAPLSVQEARGEATLAGEDVVIGRVDEEAFTGAAAATDLRTGGDAMKARSRDSIELPPTLADMGLTKDQSSRYQQLAAGAAMVQVARRACTTSRSRCA